MEKAKLIEMLNEAYNEEWLTYYQYWIGAILMEGPKKTEIKAELFIHAIQELNHALLIKSRLLELGVTPMHNMSQSKKFPRCQVPTDLHIVTILDQNLISERKAIQRYEAIAGFTRGRDHKTYQLAVRIVNEESEHEQNVKAWLAAVDELKGELKEVLRENNHAFVV